HGGGVYSSGTDQVSGGHFEWNLAGGGGGAMYVTGPALSVTGTQFIANTAGGDGGATDSNMTFLTRTLYLGNVAGQKGGALNADGTLNISQSRFIANRAASGGGVYQTVGDGLVVNALFARNSASSTNGNALYLASAGAVKVLHTTIASPTLSSGDAVRITAGNVGITDTIVSSHTIGVNVSGGTGFENYNLFYGNTLNTFGMGGGSGVNDLVGNPLFVNPPGDNYRLLRLSPAIDTGANVGVSVDLDGRPRPAFLTFDIGAYEYQPIPLFLPLIAR
ncbi:MAG TPA: choice-of-anchor Q domain-containing protein, partial [Anaerolineae bacterium]